MYNAKSVYVFPSIQKYAELLKNVLIPLSTRDKRVVVVDKERMPGETWLRWSPAATADTHSAPVGCSDMDMRIVLYSLLDNIFGRQYSTKLKKNMIDFTM